MVSFDFDVEPVCKEIPCFWMTPMVWMFPRARASYTDSPTSHPFYTLDWYLFLKLMFWYSLTWSCAYHNKQCLVFQTTWTVWIMRHTVFLESARFLENLYFVLLLLLAVMFSEPPMPWIGCWGCYGFWSFPLLGILWILILPSVRYYIPFWYLNVQPCSLIKGTVKCNFIGHFNCM